MTSHAAEITATVSPAKRPVAPAAWLSVVRLNERQLTYPPRAALKRFASPRVSSSVLPSASRRVAISTPIVLSNSLVVVTNVTASRSPASHGRLRHEKSYSSEDRHGHISVAAGCGRNNQPLVCASPNAEPVSGS